MTIDPIDLAILIVYVLLTIAFGVWISRGQKTASDYLLGGRNLPWWALLISIVATETSTATFLSVPGIAYGRGDLTFLQLPIGYIVGRWIAATFLLPLYFKGQLFTAYEALRVRSGPTVRTMASGLFLITRTLADGLRLYLAAVVLQIMLGWDLWLAVTVVGSATVFYTVLGGITAVVWTDVIQFAVYMLGAVAALFVLGSKLDDGLGGALANVGVDSFLDFGWDWGSPYTFWAGLIGGGVLSIGSHGVDQLIVQRYLSARNQRDAQRALFWSGPIVMAQFALFLVLGLGLKSFYTTHTLEDTDQVFADFIVRHLPIGLVGVVLGAVFSAAMSTLSSSLSASASALVNDFVLPLTGHQPDHPFALRAARVATVVFAGLQVGVGVSGLGGQDAVVSQVLAIATITTGIILGLFVLALLPRRSPTASLLGLAAGIAATVLVLFVWVTVDPVSGRSSPELAWPWWGLVSCGATSLVGGLFAQLLPSSPNR